MIRDITLGQYYTAEHILNMLDPRVKLKGKVAYTGGLFWIRGWPG